MGKGTIEMPSGNWRRDVDWGRPVPEIAARHGVSTKLVYHVLKSLGRKPFRAQTVKEKIIALDTTDLTIAQIAGHAKCSPSYAQTVLRHSSKACKPAIKEDYRSSLQNFYDWLVTGRKYSRKVARDVCCRVRKVEATLGLTLLSLYRKGDSLPKTMSRLNTRSVDTLTECFPYYLAPYRHALKRYWEYLTLVGSKKHPKG